MNQRNPEEVEILFRVIVNNTFVAKTHSISGVWVQNKATFQEAVRGVGGKEINAMRAHWMYEGVEKYGFAEGQYTEDLPTLYLLQDTRTNKHINKHRAFSAIYDEGARRQFPIWYTNNVLKGNEPQLRIEVHLCWSYEDPAEHNRECAFHWLAFLRELEAVGAGSDLLQEKTLDLAVECNDGSEALFLGNKRRMLKLDASNGYIVSNEVPVETRQFLPARTLQLATACEICMAVAARVGWDILATLLGGANMDVTVTQSPSTDVEMTED